MKNIFKRVWICEMKYLIISVMILTSIISANIIFRSNNIPTIAVSNIEALTQEEQPQVYTCYDSIYEVNTNDPLFPLAVAVRYCETCKLTPSLSHSGYGECTK